MASSFLKKLYYRLPLFLQVGESQRALANIETEIHSLRRELAALRVGFSHSALDELRRHHAGRQGAKSLHLSEAQICSQNGEDGVLLEIFRRIGTRDKTFVEIGVGDGRENNTAFLFSLGWTGCWVDGHDGFVSRLRERGLDRVPALRYQVALVTRENIARIFAELAVPDEFDLLSIDIDQNTYHVWTALHRFRPRVVVVEYNATIPASIDWKVAYDANRGWDGSNNFGASLKAFEHLGRGFGYSLVHCELIGANAFFVRNDLLGEHFCAPYTAEYHHQPTRFGWYLRHGHPAAILDRITPQN